MIAEDNKVAATLRRNTWVLRENRDFFGGQAWISLVILDGATGRKLFEVRETEVERAKESFLAKSMRIRH